MEKGNCEFNGSGGQYFPSVFIHLVILGALTFGFYIPWAMCRLWRLKASHTRIRGQEVSFTGQGGQLLILCLVQGFLTLVTLGIYAPWALAKIIGWKTEHTLVSGRPSIFNGTGGSLFFLYLVHLVVLPLLTLGIYYLWGVYRFYAWKEEHTLYGGDKTSFGAGLGQFIKISILSWILNTVTFQLFTPWSICWLYKWQVEGLRVGPEPEVQHFQPVKTNLVAVAAMLIIGLGIVYGLFSVVKNHAMTALMIMNQYAQVNKGKALHIGPDDLKALSSIKPEPRAAVKVNRIRTPVIKRRESKGRVAMIRQKPSTNVGALMKFAADFPHTPEAYYNKGLAYFLMGKADEAIKNYSMALTRDRKDPDTYYNRGIAYLSKGEYEKAIEDFAIAIKLDPHAADAYCNRGGANFRLGKLKRALADYNAAINISPNDPDLYHNRALVYKEMGESIKFQADLDKEKALRGGGIAQPLSNARGKGSAGWTNDLQHMNIPSQNAYGMIHGKSFLLQDAKLENGILTLRQGNNFFADREIKVFTFKAKNDSIYGATFKVSQDKKYGVPHVHLSWMENGKNLPQIKIYSGGYTMLLKFGQPQDDRVPGAIYVCLPDEAHSYVAGRFLAKLQGSVKKF